MIKFQRAEVKSLAHSFFDQRPFGNGGEVFPDHQDHFAAVQFFAFA
jgi:hypothetical protein